MSRESNEQEIKDLRERLGSIIRSHCNVSGCSSCDLKYEGGCSATDLELRIMDYDTSTTKGRVTKH